MRGLELSLNKLIVLFIISKFGLIEKTFFKV